MTNDQLIDRWLHSPRIASPLTREGYAADFIRFREFIGFDKPLADVEMGDCQRYAKHLTKVKTEQKKKLRPSRQARLLNAVKSFYSFAAKNQLIERNPALAVAVPKFEDPLAERILSREEVEKIIDAEEKPRNQLLLKVVFYSGGRVSEVINLQWRHVRTGKQGGRLALFGKGGETRIVAIPQEIFDEMIAWKKREGGKANDYVFPSQKSPQLSRHQVFRIVKAAVKKAGLPHAISTHWLRHANATIALENGASLRLVQQTLGHASLETTQKYWHVNPDDSSGLYLDKKR